MLLKTCFNPLKFVVVNEPMLYSFFIHIVDSVSYYCKYMVLVISCQKLV